MLWLTGGAVVYLDCDVVTLWVRISLRARCTRYNIMW